MNTTSEERVLFEENQVRVTNLRAIFENKTYAMSNITSVSLESSEPSSCVSATLLLVGIGLLGLFVVFLFFLAETGSEVAFPLGEALNASMFLLLGGGCLAASIRLRKLAKPTYTVRISSASGESNALSSADRDHVERIVRAMNQAIVMRG